MHTKVIFVTIDLCLPFRFLPTAPARVPLSEQNQAFADGYR